MDMDTIIQIYASYHLTFSHRDMVEELKACNTYAGTPHMPNTPESCAHYYAQQYVKDEIRESAADREFCMSAYGTPDGHAD